MRQHHNNLNRLERFINSPWCIALILVLIAAFVTFISISKPWDWQIWIDLGFK